MFALLIEYKSLFLDGFLTTLTLIGCICLVGIIVGLTSGLYAGRYSPLSYKCLQSAAFLSKGIPVLVLLFWFHYPMQHLLGIVIDPLWTTIFVLGLINAITVASLVSRELRLVPKAYRDAGQTLGLNKRQIIKYIELPILGRRLIPDFMLIQATMLEYTMLSSLIAVPEIFRVAQSVNAMVYKPVEVYSLLILFFMAILIPLHLIVYVLKRKKISYHD